MSAQVNSPNWCFSQNGYRVERDGYLRTVFSPGGEVVLNKAGYDAELNFCRENGLLVKEAA
jgi:hypothetical protein